MDNNEIKEFDLGAILSVTTGRLLIDIDYIYDILNYLNASDLETKQIPEVMEYAQPYVLSVYPQLTGVGVQEKICGWDGVKAFVDKQKAIFGDKLPLSPIPEEFKANTNGSSKKI